MSRVRPVFLAFSACFALFASAAAPLGCGTSGTTDTLTPITGITVRAEALTTGLGCGRGGSHVFKYAAVVLGKNPSGLNAFDTYLASNVFDCFSDAQFVNLPASGGSTDYSVQIYAYNDAAYTAAGGDGTVRAAALNPSALPATNPTFTTTCAATEVPNVQALAVCKPLSLGLGGGGAGTTPLPATVVLSAGSFPRGDGGVATCDTDYASVRYRASTGGTFGDILQVLCRNGVEPFTITVSPAVAPASYVIEIALLRLDGSVLGQTTCGAETSPGLTSSAVCKPIP